MRTIELARSDGGVSVMRIYDPNATPEGEIEKWEASEAGLAQDEGREAVTILSWRELEPEQ